MFSLMRKMKKNKKGFTLVELIIVVAILAILAAFLVPRFSGFTDSARAGNALSDARNYATSVDALIAQGDTTITVAEIVNYVGRNLNGMLTVEADGDFTYVKQLNGRFYVISYNANTQALSNVTPHASFDAVPAYTFGTKPASYTENTNP